MLHNCIFIYIYLIRIGSDHFGTAAMILTVLYIIFVGWNEIFSLLSLVKRQSHSTHNVANIGGEV